MRLDGAEGKATGRFQPDNPPKSVLRIAQDNTISPQLPAHNGELRTYSYSSYRLFVFQPLTSSITERSGRALKT